MIKLYAILFFLLYTLNQLTFILYNYSLFSLLCSSYLLDFTLKPQFIFSSYFGYGYPILDTIRCLGYCSSYTIFIDNYLWNLDFLFLPGNENFNIHFNSLELVSKHSYLNFIYCAYFDTKILGTTNILFYVLQNKLFIIPGETSLCFFRVLNNSSATYNAISIYTVSPTEFNVFLHKIQCFCFEELLLKPFEILELPVLFYLDPTIIFNAVNTSYVDFCIEYVLMLTSTK